MRDHPARMRSGHTAPQITTHVLKLNVRVRALERARARPSRPRAAAARGTPGPCPCGPGARARAGRIKREFICGEYSIADIATWPWLLPYKAFGESLDEFTHLQRWHKNIKERTGASKGVNVRKDLRRTNPPSAQEREILFGQSSRSLKK